MGVVVRRYIDRVQNYIWPWPISVHFIKKASRNTACSVSVADQSYRMYCVVFELVALV